MGYNNSCSLRTCSCFNLFISLIVGIIAGLFLYFDIISNILLITYISLSLGALVLLFILVGVYLSVIDNFKHLATCARRKFPSLMIGTFGTIVASILTITLGTSILIPLIIFTVAGSFFFSLMLLSLIDFVQCILCITSTSAI